MGGQIGKRVPRVPILPLPRLGPDNFLKRKIQEAVTGILYHVDKEDPALLCVPSDNDWDPACGTRISSENLDLHDWFNGSQKVTTLKRFPGTKRRLPHSFDLVHLPQPHNRLRRKKLNDSYRLNATVHASFSGTWRGNLLVFKHSKRECTGLIRITGPEVPLINSIVEK